MNGNAPFTFINSNSFTNAHTYTIASTNTNTHTNKPLMESDLWKGFTKNHCQKRFNKYLCFQVDYIQQMSPSTLPGGLCLPGRNPLKRE